MIHCPATRRQPLLRDRQQQGRRAFTLVELVLVLLIMGIMAAVAAPKYIASMHRFRADAAARRIAADLNHVRARAKMKAPLDPEYVSFYASSDKYRLWQDPDPDRPADEYWVDFAETPYPVDLVSATFTNTNGYTSTETVKYDLHGLAHSGSSPVKPLALGEIVVTSGNQTRTVVIDTVTGKARVQ